MWRCVQGDYPNACHVITRVADMLLRAYGGYEEYARLMGQCASYTMIQGWHHVHAYVCGFQRGSLHPWRPGLVAPLTGSPDAVKLGVQRFAAACVGCAPLACMMVPVLRLTRVLVGRDTGLRCFLHVLPYHRTTLRLSASWRSSRRSCELWPPHKASWPRQCSSSLTTPLSRWVCVHVLACHKRAALPRPVQTI